MGFISVSKKVFIIIINFNGWPDTKECLESLNKLTSSQDVNFEVILIDNGSREPFDYAQGIKNKFSELKITPIFNEENLGFAGANNQGIKLALENDADYVLLLNNDTTVEPDFLTKLVVEAEDDESAGIVGPLIYFHPHTLNEAGIYEDKKIGSELILSEEQKNKKGVGVYDNRDKIWSAGGQITNHVTRGELIAYNESDEGEYQTAEQVDYISGTCLLIKAEAIKKIGLISEDYFLYYEDADWGLRAYGAGWRSLLAPQAKIYHKASRSTVEASYPYIYYHSRNGLMFGERFGNKPVIYFLSVWIFLKQIVKLTVGYKRNWAKPVLRGVWDFWVGKMGKLEGYYDAR